MSEMSLILAKLLTGLQILPSYQPPQLTSSTMTTRPITLLGITITVLTVEYMVKATRSKLVGPMEAMIMEIVELMGTVEPMEVGCKNRAAILQDKDIDHMIIIMFVHLLIYIKSI